MYYLLLDRFLIIRRWQQHYFLLSKNYPEMIPQPRPRSLQGANYPWEKRIANDYSTERTCEYSENNQANMSPLE
jgi:hypothetical protein